MIKEAQIYRSGCTVTRKGTVHLSAGENKVRIAGLSSTAFTDTMQLRFDPSVAAFAVHVIAKEDEEKEAGNIKERISEIREEVETLKAQAEMWRDTAGISKMSGISVSEIESFITAYPSRIKAINKEIHDLEKELRKLNKELNEAADRDCRPLISAILKTEAEGDYPFELVYQETSAYWNSQYEIHTDGESGPVEIRVKAEIRQNTKEDWKQVKIALRTGNPVYSASLPVLKPVFLDFSQPRVINTSMRKGMLMSAAMGSVSPMAESAIADSALSGDTASLARVEMEEAEVSSTDTMTEYQLGSLYDIANGSDGLNVDLQSFRLDGKYVIKAVPKKDIRAYLLAEVRTADLPMVIHGSASVYLNGVYTGTAMIDPDYSKETYAIALGTQEKVTLTRDEKKKKSSAQLIGNKQSSVYECDIQITNGKDVPVKLSVADQVPVSTNDSITVEIISVDGAVHHKDTGELKWELDLRPQEIRKLHTEYKVTWPKDRPLHFNNI